jgi:dynein heavy chain 1
MTYIGFFDFAYRKKLRLSWQTVMDKFDLKLTQTMAYKEYLSKPQDRIKWEQEGLPNDDLCIENAIIL